MLIAFVKVFGADSRVFWRLSGFAMVKLTEEQRGKLVCLYYESGKSPTAALRRYRQITGEHITCKPAYVTMWARRFWTTGSVRDAPRAGRPTISEDEVMEVSMVA